MAVSTASGISDYITKPYLEKYPQPDRDPNIEKMVFKGEKPKAPKAKQEQPFGLDLAAREMRCTQSSRRDITVLFPSDLKEKPT